MAFTMENLLTDGEIEVVLKIDSALNMTDAEYMDYMKDLDETKLKLKPGEEPTRFVMRRSIPLKHATRIESSKLKYGDDGEINVQSGFVIEEIRACLKSVKNPPSVPDEKKIVLKFTGDGLVDAEQMASLVAAGIVNNLYNARSNALKHLTSGSLKKS